MERISSNATLMLNIFFPVFWSVLFGAFTLAIFLLDGIHFGFLPLASFRLAVLFFYGTGLAVIALTFLRLRRVEISAEHLYVTNYFKTARYPFEAIQRLESRRWLGLRLGIFHLEAAGIFGRRILFLVRDNALSELLVRFPRWHQP